MRMLALMCGIRPTPAAYVATIPPRRRTRARGVIWHALVRPCAPKEGGRSQHRRARPMWTILAQSPTAMVLDDAALARAQKHGGDDTCETGA